MRMHLSTLVPFLLASFPGAETGRAAERPVTRVAFNRDVRPILSDHCFACHGPDSAKRKAGLRLDTEQGALGKRRRGPAVIPGKPDKSELYRRIRSTDETERMPPASAHRPLTVRHIETIRRWIAQGAKWQKHWALIPPVRPAIPAVKDRAWVRNPIDAFVLERLERAGLTPAPEPKRTTLIRRVTLDLTGLSPTPAEVDAFLADRRPGAYERVVDRLLASPRYGERMVLEWLDAARYADSNGYQSDGTRTMWPWRDGVVKALNRNQPFDRFTIEQLAGDLLPKPTQEQKIATGFHRNHMLNGEGGRIAEESRVDYVVDRVDTTATVWLGLTLGCSRCHDHKFDPFTQKDYYQLFAYFNNISESGAVDRGGNAAPVLRMPTPAQTHRLAELDRTIAALIRRQQDLARARPAGYWQTQAAANLVRLPLAAVLLTVPGDLRRRAGVQGELARARAARQAVERSVVQTMVMQERPSPRDTFILIRGAYDKHGAKVRPGVPAVLPALPKGAPANRLGLARWLVSPGNPLTARVTVNRHWQTFFGTGLVRTTEDFGVQGAPPSHPELLDWLATEFVRGGWDVKRLHRLIVTSATYRQSSRLTPALRERDPDNRLLARGPRYRLSSFVLRDQALAASGLLVERLGGPPVKPYQPAGIWEEMTFGQIRYQQDKGEGLYRRSLYTFWRRTVGPTTMFDTSARQACSVRQARTNTPLQALILLNDPTYVEAARVLAERVLTEGGARAEDRLTLLFRLVTARRPSQVEAGILKNALARLRKQYGADRAGARKLLSVGERPRKAKLDVVEVAAYTALASLVLNLDEVVNKE
jgi:hypothetical protein